MSDSLYDISLTTLDGRPVAMRDYAGKVVLVVNTASKCGYTPQYKGLEALYQKYRDRGLVILGVPCNQFGSQEPGSAADIASFCEKNYGVTFPVLEKTDVKGGSAHPLFKFLTKSLPGLLGTEFIKWNFTKFLIDRTGRPVKRFGPDVKPEDLDSDVAALLG